MARKVDCYIGLGSNLGERVSFLGKAMLLLSRRVGMISAKSYVYESAPWGTFEGETYPYLNAAVLVSTKLTATEVLEELLSIETALGRTRSTTNAPRTIDLDLLYYGQQIINAAGLTVPHPLLAQRRFVLEPLVDIDPNFIHPSLGLSSKQLLQNCSDPQEALHRV